MLTTATFPPQTHPQPACVPSMEDGVPIQPKTFVSPLSLPSTPTPSMSYSISPPLPMSTVTPLVSASLSGFPSVHIASGMVPSKYYADHSEPQSLCTCCLLIPSVVFPSLFIWLTATHSDSAYHLFWEALPDFPN